MRIIDSYKLKTPKTYGELKDGDVFRFTDCICGLCMVCSIPGEEWTKTHIGLETAIVSRGDSWHTDKDRPVMRYTNVELRIAP